MQKWTRALMLSATTVALTFSSCGDKEDSTSSSPSPPAVTQLSEAKKAELGFFNHLPADTVVAFSCYNTQEIWQKIRSSELALTLAKDSGLPTTPDGKLAVHPFEQMALNIMGSEITYAQYGSALDAYKTIFDEEFLTGLVKLNSSIGAFNDMESAMAMQNQIVKLCSDYMAKLQIPPTLIAIKNGDDSYQLIKSTIDTKMGEIVEASEGILVPTAHKYNEIEFFGYKIDGKKLSEKMGDSNSSTGDVFAVSAAGIVASALKDKEAYLLLGRVGEYSVLFIGKSLDDLKLAASPSESFASSDAVLFAGNYEDKKASMVGYASKDVSKLIMDVAKSYSMTSMNDLGKKVEMLLQLAQIEDPDDKILNQTNAFVEKYKDLYQYIYTMTPFDAQMYGWWDKGLNIEQRMPTSAMEICYNVKEPLSFTGAAGVPSTIMYMELNYSQTYVNKSIECVNEAGEWVGLILDNAVKSPALAEGNPMIPMIGGMALPTLKTMGTSLKTMYSEGWGTDSAIVISTGTPGSAIPVDATLMSSIKDKAKTKEGLDGMINAGRSLGTTQMADQWAAIPSLVESNIVSNAVEYAAYTLEQNEMTQGVLPEMLISDTAFIASTSKEKTRVLADATKAKDDSKKAFFFKLSIPALSSVIEEYVTDADAKTALEAVKKDLKAIEADVKIQGDTTISSIRIVTE